MPGKSLEWKFGCWILPVARSFGKLHPLGFCFFLATSGRQRWASSTLAGVGPGCRGPNLSQTGSLRPCHPERADPV